LETQTAMNKNVMTSFGMVAVAIALAMKVTPVEAKLTKYWVLKEVINANPQYRAFRSLQACEAEKRQFLAGMKKLQKQYAGLKGFSINPSAACLDHIPYGYERPRN
jgi:hypothetical protein